MFGQPGIMDGIDLYNADLDEVRQNLESFLEEQAPECRSPVEQVCRSQAFWCGPSRVGAADSTSPTLASGWRSGLQKVTAGVAKRRATPNLQEFSRDLVKEAMTVAGPTVRERMHHLRMMSVDVKEQVLDKKSAMVSKVVNALDLPDGARAAQVPTSRPKQDHMRRWNIARAAAHRPHIAEDDPPFPPDIAQSRAASSTSLPRPRTPSKSRGILEVEVLGFSGEPRRLTCADGTTAAMPVCQLVFRERCTGCLWPRGGGTLSPDVLRRATKKLWGNTTVCNDGKEEAAAGPRLPYLARFAVDEVSGVDLRLHVFDLDSSKFAMGLEDRAFCGGALVPLSVLHYRGDSTRGAVGYTHEAEIGVRLLPIELLQLKNKLGAMKDAPKALKEGVPDLGHVLLRLRLHLFDHTLQHMLLADPYLGVLPRSLTDTGKIDDPMSVVVAVYTSMQRMRNAMDFAVYARAADELRESAAGGVLLLIWMYATLLAPTWQLPGCALAALSLLMRQVAACSRLARADKKVSFFPAEDFATEAVEKERLTLKERSKESIRKAVNMEMTLIRFARTLNSYAAKLERLSFLVSLRDPYLSFVYSIILLIATLACCVAMWVLSKVPCGLGIPLVIWAVGCSVTLPSKVRAWLRGIALQAKALKESLVGRSRISRILRNFWLRVPDGLEAQHWGLFEGRVLLPLPATGSGVRAAAAR